MPVAILLTGTVTSTATPAAFTGVLTGTVASRSFPAVSDHLKWTLTVTRNLAASYTAPFALIGGKLEMDMGDGTLVEIPHTELGPSVSLSATLDGPIGALSFQLVGAKYSPFLLATIRGKRRVRFSIYLGVPGNVAERVMFDGFTTSTSWQTLPPTVNCTATDTGGYFSEKLVYYDLAPGSFRTRLSILLEILALVGITPGQIDLGANDGGEIHKPVSVSGVRIFDFLEEFLSPCAVKIRFDRDGTFSAKPYRASGSPERTLTMFDLSPGDPGIALPPTDNANVVTVTGTVFAYDGPSGERTVETVSEVRGVYAPLVATTRRNKVDGSLTVLSLTSVSEDRVIERTVQRITYSGGTITRQERERFQWYAPKIATHKQDTAGVLSYNPDHDAYLFADGSWRAQDRETFMVTERSYDSFVFDSVTGFQTNAYHEQSGFRFEPAPVGDIGITVGGTTYYVRYVAADLGTTRFGGGSYTNIGVTADVETVQIVGLTGVWFAPNPDGSLASRSDISNVNGLLLESLNTTPVYLWTKQADPVRTDGLETGRNSGLRLTYYNQIDESTYEVTTDGVRQVFSGQVPRVQQATSKQEAQEARATARNEVEIGLNGPHYYYLPNDYCETISELRRAAEEELREQGAWEVSFTTPLDPNINLGSTVALPTITELGYAGQSLIVWSLERSLNLTNGDNSQQTTARYYPPEIA